MAEREVDRPGDDQPRTRTGWKLFWRNLEKSGPVERIKRAVRQRLGTEVRSRVEVRARTESFGGWRVCPGWIPAEAVAYCVGIGEDLDFERELAERHGVRVFAFDPTPRTVDWMETQALPDGLLYEPVGVADYDGHARLREPGRPGECHTIVERGGQTGETVSVEVRRLPTLMRELGQERIDLLKLDIEGAEYGVLEDMIASDIRPDQLLIEFHHRFRSIGNARTAEALRALDSFGYAIAYISPPGYDYVFVARDAGPAAGVAGR